VGVLHRHEQPTGTGYRIRQKLFAVGEDYWIETDGGERAFKVDGKALRVRTRSSSRTPPAKTCSRPRRRSSTCATR